MREWMRTMAIGVAMVLFIAMPALAQEGGDNGSSYGPAEHQVQATEQYQHQWERGTAEEPAGTQEQVRQRDRDGTCETDCDGVPDRDQLRDRDRDRDRDGSCESGIGTLAEMLGDQDRDQDRVRDGSCSTCPDDGCEPDQIRDRLHGDPYLDGCEMLLLMRCCLPEAFMPF